MQFSQKLINRTKTLFKEKYDVEMSDSEANESLNNLTGFFNLLLKWDAEAKASQKEY